MKSVCGYDSAFVTPPAYEKGDFYAGEFCPLRFPNLFINVINEQSTIQSAHLCGLTSTLVVPIEALDSWLSIKRTAKTLIRLVGCPG